MKILVTAGPTRESIDPARFISNPSTGKMGYAAAEAAADAGHTVIMISGPVSLSPPKGIKVISVITAEEMLLAVLENIEWCEGLIMAAAVADWRPKDISELKLRKEGLASSIALERTEDILMSLKKMKGNRVFVGFAAESHDVIDNAQRKLNDKALDLIVANDITASDSGFESDTNRVHLISQDGYKELPLMSKKKVAVEIVTWLEHFLSAQ